MSNAIINIDYTHDKKNDILNTESMNILTSDDITGGSNENDEPAQLFENVIGGDENDEPAQLFENVIGGEEDKQDIKYYEQMINKKEFLYYKLDVQTEEKLPDIIAGKYLKINSYQLPIRNFISPHTKNKRVLITHKPGCHPAGTKIYDSAGALRNVEDLQIGDSIMGDDIAPRIVQKLIRGRGRMFSVHIGTNADLYFKCNYEHVLTFYDEYKGAAFDCELYKFLTMCKIQQDGKYAPYAQYKLMMYNKFDDRSQLYDFTIMECEIDNYYGFSLNGNGRYLVRAEVAEDATRSPGNSIIIEGARAVITHNSGKTISSILAAIPFIEIYKAEYARIAIELRKNTVNNRQLRHDLDRLTPSVYVIGFSGTVAAFIRDLLRNTEFGFVTEEEKIELARRQKISLKAFSEYFNKLKHRITAKSKGGFFKFIGYQVLVNKLFISDKYKLVDIEADYKKRTRTDPNVQFVDVIVEYIRAEKISINMSMIEGFKNSFMIFDEFHHAYNTNAKNNYGAIIQYILDSVPDLRAVFITATVFNNSAFEIIDVLQFLTGKKYNKSDFFKGKEFKPGALEKIGNEIIGKVSFIQDVDLKLFPKVEMHGELLKITKPMAELKNNPDFAQNGGLFMPFLKVIKCPMSKLFQDTLNLVVKTYDDKKLGIAPPETDLEPDGEYEGGARATPEKVVKPVEEYNDNEIEVDEEISNLALETYSYHKIPPDGYTLFDGVFPNPESNKYGLYRSAKIRSGIMSADSAWQDKNGITMQPYSQQNTIFTGDFLLRDNIGKYFPKHEKMLEICDNIARESAKDAEIICNKIMIYHSNVKNTGVLLIQEALKMNGYIDDKSNVRDDTRCAKCGIILAKHKNINAKSGARNGEPSGHDFIPARFLVVHADISKTEVEDAISRFNAYDNIWGEKYCIFVGSKLIRESYDFRNVRHFIIMNLTTNIPTLRQIFGRPNRKNSHEDLPAKYRELNIYLLMTSINEKFTTLDSLSPEEYKYVDKMIDYIRIQHLECEINKNAFDADIHRNIIMSPSLLEQYFPDAGKNTSNAVNVDKTAPKKLFDALYYDPVIKTISLNEKTARDVPRITFNAYRFYVEEIKTMTYLIKYRFIQRGIWTYNELWAAIRDPPIHLEVNPKLFDENNFIIALANLVRSGINRDYSREIIPSEEYNPIGLFEFNDRIIYKKNIPHIVKHIDEYYILFPVEDKTYNIDDVETYIRGIKGTKNIVVGLNKYTRENREAIRIAKNIENINNMISRPEFNFIRFVSSYDITAQLQYVIGVIEQQWQNIISGAPKNDISGPIAEMIKQYANAGFIVYTDEIRVYRDIVKQFSARTIEKMRTRAPIGYIYKETVELYDGAAEKWFKINKIAINKIDNYREAEIIGYLDIYHNKKLQFKIRKRLSHVDDGRLIEKGIVCEFKKKPDLRKIAQKIGVKLSEDKKMRKIENMCYLIREHLIKLEIRERIRDSKTKYFYMWWDNLPKIEYTFGRTKEKIEEPKPESEESQQILADFEYDQTKDDSIFTGGDDTKWNKTTTHKIYDFSELELEMDLELEN